MALTPATKVRVRRHMGYPNMSKVQTFITGGLTAPIETSFVIEGAMDRILPEAEPEVLKLLDRLDDIEQQLECAAKDMGAVKLGNLEVNLNVQKSLYGFYKHWQAELANLLSVDANPFDRRWSQFGGGSSINVRVRS